MSVALHVCELQVFFCYSNNVIKNKNIYFCNAGDLSTPHRHVKVPFVDRTFKEDKNNVEELLSSVQKP